MSTRAVFLRVYVGEKIDPCLRRVKPCNRGILRFRVSEQIRDGAVKWPGAAPRVVEHVLVPKTVRSLCRGVVQLELSCTLWNTEHINRVDVKAHRDTLFLLLGARLEEKSILIVNLCQDLAIGVLGNPEGGVLDPDFE